MEGNNELLPVGGVVRKCSKNKILSGSGFTFEKGRIREDLLPVWCTDFQHCTDEIGVKYGCVPLGQTVTSLGPEFHWKVVPVNIQAHKLVRETGVPNFGGLRMSVHTNLNVAYLRKYYFDQVLPDLISNFGGLRMPVHRNLNAANLRKYYFDQQLPELVAFGFPLSFDQNSELVCMFKNHPSAVQFPGHIDKYF